jgi:hypothetical protein
MIWRRGLLKVIDRQAAQIMRLEFLLRRTEMERDTFERALLNNLHNTPED